LNDFIRQAGVDSHPPRHRDQRKICSSPAQISGRVSVVTREKLDVLHLIITKSRLFSASCSIFIALTSISPPPCPRNCTPTFTTQSRGSRFRASLSATRASRDGTTLVLDFSGCNFRTILQRVPNGFLWTLFRRFGPSCHYVSSHFQAPDSLGVTKMFFFVHPILPARHKADFFFTGITPEIATNFVRKKSKKKLDTRIEGPAGGAAKSRRFGYLEGRRWASCPACQEGSADHVARALLSGGPLSLGPAHANHFCRLRVLFWSRTALACGGCSRTTTQSRWALDRPGLASHCLVAAVPALRAWLTHQTVRFILSFGKLRHYRPQG